jgi:hypothetical protein
MIEWRKIEYGECERMDQVPAGAEILSVNDVPSIGNCEVCRGPILETEGYHSDSEGILWHIRDCKRGSAPCGRTVR